MEYIRQWAEKCPYCSMKMSSDKCVRVELQAVTSSSTQNQLVASNHIELSVLTWGAEEQNKLYVNECVNKAQFDP